MSMSTSSRNMEKNRVLKPFVNNNVVQDKLKKRKEIFEEVSDKNNKKIKTTNTDYFTLNTGDKMPIVQFGTYKMKGEECYKSVLSAIKMGYKGRVTTAGGDPLDPEASPKNPPPPEFSPPHLLRRQIA